MSVARSHKALPVAEWPELDRQAWRKAQIAGDEFSDSGNAAHLQPRSRENAELAWGRYLGFLKRNGSLQPMRGPGERLHQDAVCAFGRELSMQLAPYTVLGIFGSLGTAMRAMHPKADRGVLNQISSRLARKAKSVREITANLIAPRELLTIGLQMMDEAEAIPNLSWRSAGLYRDGLLIAFMTFCPLRPGAVSEMQIGEHLIVQEGSILVRFSPTKGKKRRIESVPLPELLVGRFMRYIKHYRPYFQARGILQDRALWLSRNGNPIDRDGLSKRIKERMRRRAGKCFTAHMFRHACATFIVDVAPEHARMIAGVLGHRDLRTAHRHYIKGLQHMAVKNYQRAVRDLASRTRSREVRRTSWSLS